MPPLFTCLWSTGPRARVCRPCTHSPAPKTPSRSRLGPDAPARALVVCPTRRTWLEATRTVCLRTGRAPNPSGTPIPAAWGPSLGAMKWTSMRRRAVTHRGLALEHTDWRNRAGADRGPARNSEHPTGKRGSFPHEYRRNGHRPCRGGRPTHPAVVSIRCAWSASTFSPARGDLPLQPAIRILGH